ncbi:hypothetical protein C8R45DRAFT_1070025 [Mycena sanguinolenta]|nr:hypothetical protein C8R45DRAFT_1070025 [Mycena sanguinolenta]
MPFTELDEDILLTILRFCDVYTVLTMSAINKPFRRLALTKQLWLSLIQNNTFRRALELPPVNLEELKTRSTEELIELVKGAVVGPGPPCSVGRSTRTINYEIVLKDMNMDIDTRLLPGSQYIVLHCPEPSELRIYDVWSAQCVWTRSTPVLTRYQIDLMHGTSIARVLLAEPISLLERPCPIIVHIEEVDLTTGISHEVFDLGFVTTSFGSSPSFVGDFLLWTTPSSRFVNSKLLLVNWRLSTYVVLSEGVNPSHIGRPLVLSVTTLKAFASYWRPLTELNIAKEVSTSSSRWPAIAATVEERLEYSSRPFGVQLSVTPNALSLGAYNIVVQACEFPITERKRGERVRQALLSYRFTPALSTGRGCKLQLIKQRAFNTAEMSSPRAVSSWSDRSIIVSYRQ